MALDGVMQAPSGPEEDPYVAFEFCGWQAPFNKDVTGEVVEKELKQI